MKDFGAEPSQSQLQQYLPFTVLKRKELVSDDKAYICDSCNSTYRLRYWNYAISKASRIIISDEHVATVLTVYGIETNAASFKWPRAVEVATVLTVYGIETITYVSSPRAYSWVATVLTVYGIETIHHG